MTDMDERFAEAIRLLYDVLLLGTASAWPELGDALSAVFGAPMTTIMFYQGGVTPGRTLARIGQFADTENKYRDYYWRLDPAVQMLPHDGRPRVSSVESISELARDYPAHREYFADFVAPRFERSLFAVLPMERRGFFAFGAGRSKQQRPFDQSHVHRFRELAHHWHHAQMLAQSIHRVAHGTAERPLLEAMLHGVALIDREGRVAYLNAAATATVNGTGAVTCNDSRLEARHPRDRARLKRAIQLVLSGSAPAASASLVGGGLPAFTVAVIALTDASAESMSELLPHEPVAAAVFGDPVPPSLDALASTFGFTPGERVVAARAVLGERVPAIATALGLSVETVRTHLQHMFRKTGAQSQPDFVRILLTSTAAVTGSAFPTSIAHHK